MSRNLRRPVSRASLLNSGAGLCRALHGAILLTAVALTGATDGGTFTPNGTARLAAIDGPILGGRGGAVTTSFARLGDGGTGVVQSDRGPVEVTVPIEPPAAAADINGTASGMIRDGCTGNPMSGATVSLEKNEPLRGSNYVVPDPHETIPTNNPEITGVDGRYAWGVVPGRWRIRASKAGYDTATVDPFDVPPPVTGLDVTMMPTGRCDTPPVAKDDAYSTPQATTLNVGAPGVLANDTDGEGGVLRAVLVTKTSHGQIALATDGSFNYTPNASFCGGDSFTYKANDGRDDSNVATVSITVGKVNRPPIAKDDTYCTTKDRAFLISAPGVLVNDTDLEGLPLTAKPVQRAVHGFALLNANGSFVYLPAKEFVGKDTFTYTASNGLNTSNLARVTIDVTRERGHNEENHDRDNGHRCLGEGQVPTCAQAAAAAIAFVQRNYATPQTPASSVSVLFNGPQSAGNLNVVVVGWKDTTAQVSSVTDTNGNAYQLAVGPTAIAGALTQAIYYASNIAAAAAGANTVKVSFTVGAVHPDIRILEYGGIDPVSPLDVQASATGSTTTSRTPAVVTTNASELLFAANTVATWTTGAGKRWTSRVITSSDGDIAEDRVVSDVGRYKATAHLGSASPWIMQLVAFKAISCAPPPPPTAPTNLAAAAAGTAQINLSWTNTSTSQTGVKIERSIDNVTFAEITVADATAASYPDIGLSASTTYFYRVRATSSSGDSAYSNTASATTAAPARPTLVQNLSTYTNRDVEVGNDFIINLASPTLANNCLILALTNAYSSTRTITVSDDKGNPWTTGPHTDFVANTETTTIFYALGVAAGTQSITIHFDASIFNVHATVSEWYNIATTVAVNGSSAASDVASPVSPGAFTPGNNDANGGNLIYHHAIAIPGSGSLGNLASFVSAINVDTGFTLASANRELASISQYTVQTTAAAINPTLTVGEADHFNTIAVAFKAAVAGTAPSTNGIRVQNVQHTFHPFAGSSTVNLPSSGNLLVLTAPVNTGQDEITSVTDSNGNAWTKVAGESPNSPQFWYAVNATPSNDLTISFDLANNTSLVVIAWDIIGAATAPFDKFAEATGAQILAGDDITSAPVITPTTANGLVIGLVNLYTGPPTSMIGVGYVADHIFYTGQTDGSILDLGDGTAHIYNSDTSPLSFGWHQTTHPPTTGWFAIAVALKAAP